MNTMQTSFSSQKDHVAALDGLRFFAASGAGTVLLSRQYRRQIDPALACAAKQTKSPRRRGGHTWGSIGRGELGVSGSRPARR